MQGCTIPKDNAMKRDFLVISAGVVAAYFVASSFWLSPAKMARMVTHDQLDLDQDLKLVSEQSPYMRNER